MRMTRERKNMNVGLIVERTFRDSSQPLALPENVPPFTRRPINLNRPNFPSPSPSLRTFDKTYGLSILSIGLSFDERPDETLTEEKYVWHLIENHFSTLDNGNFKRKQNREAVSKKKIKTRRKILESRFDEHSPTIRFDFFVSSTGNRGLISAELNSSVPNLFIFLDINVDRYCCCCCFLPKTRRDLSFLTGLFLKNTSAFDFCFLPENSLLPFSFHCLVLKKSTLSELHHYLRI